MNLIRGILAKVPVAGFLLLTSFYLLPLLASASGKIEIFTNPNTGLSFIGFANKIQVIANAVIPFLVGLAVVAIIWGIFKYVKSAGDAEKIAEGRKTIVYGIVALFIMVAFWGLVLAIKKSLFG